MPDKSPTHALTLALYDDGWRVISFPVEGQARVSPITVAEAETIARGFSDVEVKSPSPFEIVRKGSNSLRDRLKIQLQEAEQNAAKIPKLRQVLAEVESQT